MKLVYRSPKLNKYAGWYLRVWNKWYRIIKVGEN